MDTCGRTLRTLTLRKGNSGGGAPCTQPQRQEDQAPRTASLHSKFEASLSYTRPCLKNMERGRRGGAEESEKRDREVKRDKERKEKEKGRTRRG